MKLVRVRLRNFRCYKEEISFALDKLVMFVGRNDIGKSSVFDALNAFFWETKLDPGDASITGDPTDVRIICEFDEFTDDIILYKDYVTNLEDEYLLNSLVFLEIHHVWNCSLKVPKASFFCYGIPSYFK